MKIKKLLIVAGALALAGCYPSTAPCEFAGHGDELDESLCILPDEGAVVTPPSGVVVQDPDESP